MIKFLKSLFDENKKTLKQYQYLVDAINDLEPEMQKLEDSDFVAKTAEFKARLQQQATLDDILPEVYALSREVAKRVLGLRMHDVQLLAAIAFHKGNVAEQKTGEGKTLSAVPALYLNSLTGKGTHLVTVNDYLAKVGVGWMAPVFKMLDVSVGVIYSGKGDQPAAIYDADFIDETQHDERMRHLKPSSRKKAYACDIIYGTNNEFGFDYLRDNMAQSLGDMVQRGHHYAIVDEVDSILIDEARTPLIISAPDTEPTDKYYRFAEMSKTLSIETDYVVDEKLKAVSLTEHGISKIEKLLNIDNLYEKDFEIIHHIENALRAKAIYLNDRDYVVKDDSIIIVDEFTGRMMYGRRWADGLHQAIEAKEAVTIQQESKTLATISFQNYFRMYQKLAGMTGTAATEAEEFQRIYGLSVVVIPTDRPITRKDNVDVVYKTSRAKYTAIAEEVKALHEKGQPVLVGTTSIDKNQIISNFLKHKKVPHNVLNAKNHENEALIIADAGKVGAVTIATNIAGRGVDIVLGGAQPEKNNYKSKQTYQAAVKQWEKEHQKVLDLGGLFVAGSERHESRRIDNQLRGRSGRQGDPGGSRFYVSLDDDIMRIFGGEQVSKLMSIFKLPENVPLEHPMVSKAIIQAQVKVEGFHFDSRKRVVEYDDVVNKQREIIYKRRYQILQIADKQRNQNSTDQSLKNTVLDNLHQDIALLVGKYAAQGYTDIEYQQIIREFAKIIPFDMDSQNHLQSEIEKYDDTDKIVQFLQKIVDDAYNSREQEIGESTMREIEIYVSLSTLDKLWMEHLDSLDSLREGIGLRGYGQRDPLVEYKGESFDMFERLLENIDYEISRQILRIQPAARSPQPSINVSQAKTIHAQPQQIGQKDDPTKTTNTTIKHQHKKIGRNDPCWCGSGKKWKKCHYPKLG